MTMKLVRSPMRYLAVGAVALFPTIALALFQAGAGEGAVWPKNSAGITQISVCFRGMGTTSQDAQNNPYKVGYLRDAVTASYINPYATAEWIAKRELVRDMGEMGQHHLCRLGRLPEQPCQWHLCRSHSFAGQ